MLTDPIADFLTRIRNAGKARRHQIIVNSSGMRKAIIQVLAQKGFIKSVEENKSGDGKITKLTIVLRSDRKPLHVKRISRPGQRIYVGYKNIKRVRNGTGVGLFSTSFGILTDKEAREKKIGGEYICEVY